MLKYIVENILVDVESQKYFLTNLVKFVSKLIILWRFIMLLNEYSQSFNCILNCSSSLRIYEWFIFLCYFLWYLYNDLKLCPLLDTRYVISIQG
jgi:hypothetical protein